MTDREKLDALAEAVRPLMGTLNYYTGPSARTAVSRESQMQYWTLLHALCRAEGKPCPRCHDEGVDRHYVGAHRCALADAPGHPLVAWVHKDRGLVKIASSLVEDR